MARQVFVSAFSYRLRGVDMSVEFNDAIVRRENEPVLESFPDVAYAGIIPDDKPGLTVTRFKTRQGSLAVKHLALDHTVDIGARPYMTEHIVREDADFGTIISILEIMELLPRFHQIEEDLSDLGEEGYIVPLLPRIPFQQVLLDYLGVTKTCYTLYDQPGLLQRLLAVLNERMLEMLDKAAGSQLFYFEFADNLDGVLTNPRLFATYCLSRYQLYTTILHAAGKRVGSHTDGDLTSLLPLLAETGLDVCESFTPVPLTSCRVEDALEAFGCGPLIWGGFPSVVLEDRIPYLEFADYVEAVLEIVADSPIIFGIGDLVGPEDSLERVRHIGAQIRRHNESRASRIQART
jgi:hypothetical protein